VVPGLRPRRGVARSLEPDCIRQRLGIDVFQRFFEKVVDLCQEAGLVWGQELYFDATNVEANAGIPSLVPRFSFEAKTHVADLFAEERDADGAKGPAPEEGLPAGMVQLPTATNAESAPMGDERSHLVSDLGVSAKPPRSGRA
jgi:hypothetical protein